MKRILVMGISAGVGKSTFARKLGEQLDIPVYHLDALHWKPGWVETTKEEFSKTQEQIVCNDSWIIEGNYSNTYDVRMPKADTIIYLELPLIVCLYRVVKRRFLYIGKTRPDMGKGCKEKLDWAFIKFILTTYHSRKKKMEIRLREFQESELDKTVILLKNKRDIKLWSQSHVEN